MFCMLLSNRVLSFRGRSFPSRATVAGRLSAPLQGVLVVAILAVFALPLSAAEVPDFSPGGPIEDVDLANYHVVIDCAVGGKPVGSMTLMMLPELAPITTRNFLRHVAAGFYDGMAFDRVFREQFIEGGSPTEGGGGQGLFGTIVGEFPDDPRYAHGYGVVSMARADDPDSASCRFSICCAEGAQVWGLDGERASFAYVVDGTAALEAIANIPTLFGVREKSKPTQSAKMARVRVVEGAPEKTARVERPPVDLGGEPELVTVQNILISFSGRVAGATRTEEEAKTLASDLLARALEGEDFEAMVRKYSDNPPDESNPGTYRLTNTGCVDFENERRQFEFGKAFVQIRNSLEAQVRAGEMTMAEFHRQLAVRGEEQRGIMGIPVLRREQVAPLFGEMAFSLDVDEIALVPFDARRSPFGWNIMKRLQ